MAEAVAILLAAGRGTRMRSPLPKPLVPLAGRGLILHLLEAVAQGTGARPIVVVGHGAAELRAALPPGLQTAEQSHQDGMASAVECARQLAGDADLVYVMVGDGPLLRPQSLAALAGCQAETGADCAVLTADFGAALPYARIVTDAQGRVLRCVEERDCSPEELPLRRYLSSHYLFRAEALWPRLGRIQPHPRTGERYLTDIIGLILEEGGRVETCPIEDWTELVGLNTPEEVAWAEALLARRAWPAPARRAEEALAERWGPAVALAWAPGRINIIGEHTDYNEGLCLPAAIERHTAVALRPCAAQEAEVLALDLDQRWRPGEEAPADWARGVQGALRICAEAWGPLPPIQAAFGGDVPRGAGLSSSAALWLSWVMALRELAGRPPKADEDIALAMKIEHEALGVPCGGLDQTASRLARRGRAMMLDFQSGRRELVPLRLRGMSWVLIHSGVERALSGSAYAQRVAECQEGLARVQARHPEVRGPRDLRPAHLPSAGPQRGRLAHQIGENARVIAMATALAQGDARLAGALLRGSHRSLSKDYEVSLPELDLLVGLCCAAPGCAGARLMGAGFGGCALALVRSADVSAFCAEVTARYAQRTGLRAETFEVRLGAGAASCRPGPRPLLPA